MSKRLPVVITSLPDIPKEYIPWDVMELTIDWKVYRFRYVAWGFIGSREMSITKLNKLCDLPNTPHLAAEYIISIRDISKPRQLTSPSIEVAQYEKQQAKKVFNWKITNRNLEKDLILNEDGFIECWEYLTSFFNNDLGEVYYRGSRCYVSNSLYLDNWEVPLPFFGTKDDTIFFGLELEYHYLRNYLSDFTSLRRKKRRQENTFFVFKGDGSLNNGVETNTAPFSINYYNYKGKQYIRNLVEDAVMCGARDGTQAGLHIHISRTIWASECEFIRDYVVSNQGLFERLGWRSENQYCQYKKDTQKYRAVAFHKSKTIELRFMASSQSPSEVLGRVELAMGLVCYARSIVKAESVDKPSFVDYINGRDWFTELKKLIKLLPNEQMSIPVLESTTTTNTTQSSWNVPLYTMSTTGTATTSTLTFTPSQWTYVYTTTNSTN